MKSRIAALALLGAACALPASATAAPIPGAHYEGTTDNGSPFSFDVSPDGASVTNVTGSVSAFCSNGGGFQIVAIASTFAFPAPGNTISGEDEDGFPRLTMTGTFSGSDATGTVSTNHAYTQNGALIICGTERTWTARTTSAAPGGGGGTGGGGGGTPTTPTDPTPTTPTTPATGTGAPPAISVTIPKNAIKLGPSLTNGFVIAAGVDQPAALTGTATLSAKDAKRYGLGKKAKVIARDKVANADSDSLLEFVPSKSAAKKLRKAKKLTLTIEVVAKRADGVTGRATTKIRLKR